MAEAPAEQGISRPGEGAAERGQISGQVGAAETGTASAPLQHQQRGTGNPGKPAQRSTAMAPTNVAPRREEAITADRLVVRRERRQEYRPIRRRSGRE